MIRTIHIPTIGEELLLAEDWTFPVLAEYRNASLMEHLRSTGAIPTDAPTWVDVADPSAHGGRRREYARYSCTAPRGTKLSVSRIYIRNGKADYDSLTFWASGFGKKKVRFFAKLADVNRMRVTDKPLSRRTKKAAPLVLRAISLD